jgi:uroporphyrinogen decarboxylase
MTSRERVIRALERKEADRVPTFEWAIDRKVCRALTGSEDSLEAIVKLGVDGVVVRADYSKQRIDAEIYLDEWGCRRKVSGESLDVIVQSPIQDIHEHEKYRFPDPHAPHRLASLKKAVESLGRSKAIVFNLRDVFSDIRDLVGYENALIALLTEQQAYSQLLERVMEYNRTLARIARERYGVNIVATTDDIADSRGLIFSPRLYFSLLAPRMAEVIRGYKELGYFCIKHCDGNVKDVLGHWIDIGVDCIDPIDPNGGMDIARIKKQFGARVCLKGNINCQTSLVSGTEQEVIEEVKRCIEHAGSGGGFILSSSNTIHSGVKPQNYRAMLDALQRYGTYNGKSG